MTQENKDRLHKAADEYAKRFSPWLYSCIMEAFVDGAEWQKEQLEKSRLEHCDNIMEKQYNLESDFVTEHIKKNNRMPTFLDAIEYGMQLGRNEGIMKDCTFCSMPNCEARNSSSKDKCRLEHPNITLNRLIKKATSVSRQITSGDIPLTLNGEPIDIVDITLEGENGNYHADIKAVARKESKL